ncbi:MAG: carbon-nitrogen hydrolase family protein, partial [Syntrophomonadaceae bacterium]|nr:carbon-nitrogen hydrolase family protein [Syntrophomonadaceae bacterium]
MSRIKLAIVQFPRRQPDRAFSIEHMARCLSAVDPDTDVVLLPEGWLGPSLMEDSEYQATMEELLGQIKAPDCLLASGAQYVKAASGRPLARGFFLSRQHPPVAYEKLFPSQAIGERRFIAPGSRLPVVEHRGLLVGAVVCVDFFYPEVVRSLALRGAVLILNPANIPANRMPLWHHLGVTRACENTVFVAMANNTEGIYPDRREIKGDSFVAFPDGYQLITFGPRPGIYYSELDLALIDQVRERWPYLEDLRRRGREIPN